MVKEANAIARGKHKTIDFFEITGLSTKKKSICNYEIERMEFIYGFHGNG